MRVALQEINTGSPKLDGRYVAFVQCEAAQAAAWVEPIIMAWSGERWHTTFIAQRRVLGWIGPLPVLKVADLDRSRGEMITVPVLEPMVPVSREPQVFDL